MPPPLFLQLLIPREIKSNDFVGEDAKGVVGAFFASARCKGFARGEMRESWASNRLLKNGIYRHWGGLSPPKGRTLPSVLG